MSTRPHIAPFPAIVNGVMSGNITSKITIIQKLSMMSYAYSWSGTSPVGTITVQVSNDYELSGNGQTVVNAGTWDNLTFLVNGVLESSIAVSGNTGNGFLDIFQTGAFAIRTVYTAASGSGTLQATFNAKVS